MVVMLSNALKIIFQWIESTNGNKAIHVSKVLGSLA